MENNNDSIFNDKVISLDPKEKKKKELKRKLLKYGPVIGITVAIIIIVLLVIFSLSKARDELETYTIENHDVYFYSADNKFEYSSDVTLNHDGNVTKLKFNDSDDDATEFGSDPIYYKDKREAIFPQDMSVVYPMSTLKQYKINYYTFVDGTTSQVILKNISLNVAVTDAFIYDGYDLYFLVDKSTLKVGDKEYVLGPMSYVHYSYKSDLTIYDYDNDKLDYFDTVTDDVILSTNNYSVNLGSDTVTYQGRDTILIKSVSTLPNLK